ATARDALQESWVIVLEKLYQYRGRPPACGWVGAIVRHEAGHAAARTNRDVPLRTDEPSRVAADLDETLHRRQLVRVLLEAIDHLPPTYADIVRMRDLDERPVAEVGRNFTSPLQRGGAPPICCARPPRRRESCNRSTSRALLSRKGAPRAAILRRGALPGGSHGRRRGR
ncbi:MAG: sigma-70 family RNA polymerase sigma factor, partial [Chloroflexi bacterium]|nr:sigma-70 family RNA polymerase sigma factor [Chloroflexota bacterium]